jgi:hypothetical protein
MTQAAMTTIVMGVASHEGDPASRWSLGCFAFLTSNIWVRYKLFVVARLSCNMGIGVRRSTKHQVWPVCRGGPEVEASLRRKAERRRDGEAEKAFV